jgi:uncharacterized protein YjbI with pentapeptide repeats
MEPQPSDLAQLRAALAAGQKDLRSLRLGEIDGLDLDLSGCNLDGSCFKEARFGHATLRGAQAHRCCFQQALIWGADLSELDAPSSYWHEADLSGSRLQGANFSDALMHRCCLRGVVAARSVWRSARLVEADFRSGQDQLTDLGYADFSGADLSFALLQGANLHAAILKGSCLYGANLRGCDLRGADLRDCDLRDTQLQDAQMDGALID